MTPRPSLVKSFVDDGEVSLVMTQESKSRNNAPENNNGTNSQCGAPTNYPFRSLLSSTQPNTNEQCRRRPRPISRPSSSGSLRTLSRPTSSSSLRSLSKQPTSSSSLSSLGMHFPDLHQTEDGTKKTVVRLSPRATAFPTGWRRRRRRTYSDGDNCTSYDSNPTNHNDRTSTSPSTGTNHQDPICHTPRRRTPSNQNQTAVVPTNEWVRSPLTRRLVKRSDDDTPLSPMTQQFRNMKTSLDQTRIKTSDVLQRFQMAQVRRRQRRAALRAQRIAMMAPQSKWLIPASHPLKVAWDICTVLLSILGAYNTHASIRDRSFNISFGGFIEVWFAVDILLNFVTQHKTASGEVIRDGKSVWARYLTTWFIVDALSLIPWESIYVKPIVEMQKRRGFVKKSFFRTKAVIRVSRILRGHHFKLFGRVARKTKHAGYGAKNLVRLLIRYVPKYLLFYRNMRGVLAVRGLRQVHWIRKVFKNLFVTTKLLVEGDHIDDNDNDDTDDDDESAFDYEFLDAEEEYSSVEDDNGLEGEGDDDEYVEYIEHDDDDDEYCYEYEEEHSDAISAHEDGYIRVNQSLSEGEAARSGMQEVYAAAR